jgi:phage-related baseplate assembly protein
MAVPQIRDFPTLTQSLIRDVTALAPELTDFVPGSIVRSLLETVGIELQRQDYAIFDAIRQAIETGTFQNFDFNRLSATPAGGLVSFSRTTATTEVTISAGHRVRVPGSTRQYATTAAATLEVGVLTLDVGVQAETVGPDGNTPAGTVVELVDGLVGFTITNPAPFLNGLAQESANARRQRFLLYIAGLSRGTAAAIQFAALSVQLLDAEGEVVERVTGAQVHEPYLDDVDRRIGMVEVWIDNGSGTVSAALVAETIQVLRGYREADGTRHEGWVAAGIDLQVYAVAAQIVNVTGTVAVLSGFDGPAVAADVAASMVSYIQSVAVFQPVVYAELIAAAMEVDGVQDVTLTEPTGNVNVIGQARAIPGTVSITVS